MPSGLSLDAKLRVKEAVDIVDLVGSYLQLRREGRILKALCPWHDDTRPSLQVNPERQSFKCWVCDIGGDIFSFLMKIENLTFPEALAMLAERAGVALDAPAGAPAGGGDQRKALYEALDWAIAEYHRALLESEEGEAARRYLAERGISDESIRRLKLGYAPQAWDWLSQRARQMRIGASALERAGMIARRDGAGYYDRFRGRVLFPIWNAQGKPVGFGGRVLPGPAAEATAKYINSPETPLFRKSELLYGLHTARDAIRRQGCVLVMEGYTDCIMARQFGFENAVAVLGTALGPAHLRLLAQQASDASVVLVLDGDEAGRRRASEVLELFVASRTQLRVLTLPDQLDPCEFLLQRGAAALEALIEQAPDALSHAVRVSTDGVDLARDVHGSAQALERLVGIVARAPRPDSTEGHLRQQKFLSRLGSLFGVSEEEIRARRDALRKQPVRASQQAAPASTARIEPCERELLEILVKTPDLLERVAATVRAEDFAHEGCRTLYASALRLSADGETPTFERLLLEIEDPTVKNLLVELDEIGRSKNPEDPQGWLDGVLRHFTFRKAEPLRRARSAALQDGRLKEEEELELLLEIEQLEKARHGIPAPTDG